MSTRFPGMMGGVLRHQEDTRSASWWVCRFVLLNSFQVTAALWFAAVALVSRADQNVISYGTLTHVLFGLGAFAFVLLLVAPHIQWVRVMSVIVPGAAVSARLIDLTNSATSLSPWLAWLWIALTVIVGSVKFMPPPLTNGERRRWLCRERGAASGLG